MLRLIASDMDGTLISSNHHVSTGNAEAIKKAQAQGVEFIISTGRSFEDAHKQVEEAGISCNYLVMNGSELRGADGNIIFNLYLNHQVVKDIVADLLDKGLAVEIYSTAGTFVLGSIEARKWAIATKINNFHSEIPLEEAFETADEHFLYKELKPITDVQELFDNGYQVGKIISFSPDKDMIAILRKEIPKHYYVTATGSFAINLEITNPEADKGRAIENYARTKGIADEDIMVIGDSFNDLSMQEKPFGYTVAMGNAIPEVKRIAKYITDTNDNDGVGKAILKFL